MAPDWIGQGAGAPRASLAASRGSQLMVGVGEPEELVDVSGLALSSLEMERSGVFDRDQFASPAPPGSSSQSLGRGVPWTLSRVSKPVSASSS